MEQSIFQIPAIDIHSHLGPVHGPMTMEAAENGSEAYLLRTMDAAKIQISVNSSRYAIMPRGSGCSAEGNRQMLEAAHRLPGVYMWAVVDPHEPETFAQARTMLEDARVLGIKIHPAEHEYDLEQYGDSIFSFAEALGVPVLGHSGEKGCMPEVYAANVNSVVSINVSTTTNVFGRTTESAASGSGFFITKDGYILTNYHVIEGASTVKVTAYDGTTYDAAVIGGDEDYDIAVIKVEGTNFQPVVIGKSGSVQIGETVAAVGNPLGELTFSMSQGIVSCVNRAINVDGKPFNMIQVDCSINPGNSGGPLFNSYGEVIGIVSAKYSSYSNTTVEGIGFAIPIDDVLAMVKDIMTNGYVTNKAYIGITPQTMNAQMAQQFRYDVTQGVFVCSVEPGSAAEKAGLQMGDVITKIGDTAISDMNDLNAAKKSYRAGDTVTLTIYRAGGTKEVELTFDAAPQTQETAQDSSQQQQQGGSNGGYYYNPWDFFNNFFGYGG